MSLASGSVGWLRLLSLGALLVSSVLPGCASDAGDEDPDDDDDGFQSSDIQAAGSWKLPADVQAAGQTQNVRYDDSGPWRGAAGCGGAILAGTRELGDHVKKAFPGAITSYGGYSCRQNTANKAKTSVHGTGRALDLMIPLDRGQADNGKGDPIANWLVQNAATIGVQLIIWDRTIWQASAKGTKAKGYTGPHPHHDHIHVEINNDGAGKKTAFFNGNKPGAGGGAGGGEVEGAISVSWPKASDGAEYSLDVVLADGTKIAPCIGDNELGQQLAWSFDGNCLTSGKRVELADVKELVICSAENDDWANATCKGSPVPAGAKKVAIP